MQGGGISCRPLPFLGQFAHRVMRPASWSPSVVLETARTHVHYSGASVNLPAGRSEASMAAVTRSSAAIVIGAGLALVATGARAASDVDVGGFHDQAIATTQQNLMGTAATPPAVGSVQIRTNAAPGSALTGFTPRLGGLAIAGRRHSEANLQVDEEKREAQRVQLGLSDTAEVAGWEIGLAATADMGRAPAVGSEEATSEFVVGGQLAVSGLRLDAAVGRDTTLLGEPGSRMTAGVGYDFGRLDTHMSYSLIETDQRTTETGLLTLGSSFALSSSVELKGDLAIADQEDGEGTTAGRVSLRLNF